MPSPKHDPSQAHHPLVFASLRPTTIYETDDPTLDPLAITHAQPPPDRLLPGILSLGIYGALALGCVYLATHGNGSFPDRPMGTERVLDILFEPEVRGKHVPEVREGPSGGGRGGTGSLDPRFVLAETDIPTSKATDLDPADFVLPANQPLPLAPGGDGLSKGLGPGSGGGTRGGTGAGSGILIAINKVKLFYQLAPGQTQSPCIIVVVILIEADGHVSYAHAVSGPTYLFPAAEAAARQWTFEPLIAHGLQAPYKIKINFHYKTESKSPLKWHL